MVLPMRSKFIRKQVFYHVLDDEAKLRMHPLLIHAHAVVATINVRFIFDLSKTINTYSCYMSGMFITNHIHHFIFQRKQTIP